VQIRVLLPFHNWKGPVGINNDTILGVHISQWTPQEGGKAIDPKAHEIKIYEFKSKLIEPFRSNLG
jgi:hypothetical protein